MFILQDLYFARSFFRKRSFWAPIFM